jgi:hypothetical protein
MLSKCANPDCGASFHYLGEGKLYEIRYDAAPKSPQPFKKAAGRSERFWLCDQCSNLMTLAVDSAKKVILMPLPRTTPMVKRAIAS